MNRNVLLIGFLGIFIVAGCRKDDPNIDNESLDSKCDTVFNEMILNDTIFPSEYLMAYPGSWWEYSDGTIISSSAWESVPICEIAKPSCYEVTRTYQVLPDYNGIWIKNEYELRNDSDLVLSNLTKILGGNEGDIYSSIRDGDYLHTTTYLQHLDSLEVEGVIYYDIVKTHYTNEVMDGTVPMFTVGSSTIYYSKNVGVVRIVNQNNNGVSGTRNLIDYHIEPY